MSSVEQKIIKKLTLAFSPNHLKVVNESARHAGHSGDDGSGESHFSVEIKSPVFTGKSRLEAHRMIFSVLEKEMKVVHALSLKIKKI